ncbi:twin-arginine translocase TatA/TatE family subunit [Pseudomonas sp. P105]|uniref:twin-arginine translocase TatA/TatE family subunit n=1 Tax=Pseudomonas sp. P105 TaxID=3049542 RepID=UPI002934B93E|nr:twin-arginine translocase TatA/TatE family subunit [Pseudomonas sp. P105]WNZ81250.1 twin-arginine translocase TatA/TatE family subunit [Pseudomonas sp. P105]
MGIFDWKHWAVILIVVILVFGTKKLKTLGSDMGETIKGFRKAMNEEENKPGERALDPEHASVNSLQSTHAKAQAEDWPKNS